MQATEVDLNVFEAILARRSVRAYTPQEVDRTMIGTLLEAAVRAPTAMHGEPWAFIVLQGHEALKKLSDLAKPVFLEQIRKTGGEGSHSVESFANPNFNLFHDAGTLILIGSTTDGPFTSADCWLAAENLMLAGCALGLGTCVIGAALPALNLPQVKAQMGIPGEFTAIAPIIVGHPRGETSPTTRKPPLVLNIGMH